MHTNLEYVKIKTPRDLSSKANLKNLLDQKRNGKSLSPDKSVSPDKSESPGKSASPDKSASLVKGTDDEKKSQ